MHDRVVLVNEQDVPSGSADKLEAHLQGWLHRAFSIFVFDTRGRLLLQRRNPQKYHSGGLWSNTCCSHPRPDEPLDEAVQRRLDEEMGFRCDLHHAFGFVYRADVGNGLVEHEYDHVFLGIADADVTANPDEVSDWRWADPADLRADVALRPDQYTFWFRHILDRTLDYAARKAA